MKQFKGCRSGNCGGIRTQLLVPVEQVIKSERGMLRQRTRRQTVYVEETVDVNKDEHHRNQDVF